MVLAVSVLGLVAGACLPSTPLLLPTAPGQTCPDGAQRWSSPATWPTGVPTAGEDVTIPRGTTVALDADTAPLGGLTIEGTLVVCRQDVELTAAWIMLHGVLQAGTPTVPFAEQFTITLTGDDPDESVMGMGTRGLLVMGGRLWLFGDAPEVTWTKLAAHAPAGTTTLELEEPVDWQPGDQVIVTNTDWYGAAATERHVVAAVSGTQVELATPLAAPRWGLLQHVTTTGMSLEPDPSFVPPAEPTPTVLDERAEVANLSRNIVIQAPDDTLWQTDRFGAHVMIMDLATRLEVDGVEFRRMGQAGRLGRYPVHWHRLSYGAGGAELGDATGHVLRNSTVTDSANRCITIHATNGVLVEGNVCTGIRGHGVFLEDAVERRNTIVGNLVAGVRNPPEAVALKRHEVSHEDGSSGMWLSNPDNTVRDNVVSDAQGFGFWLAYPERPFGLSADVAMRPDRLLFGVFEQNTAHSNRFQGVMLDEVEIDEAGNTFPHQYWSTTDGQEASWPFDTLRRFSIHRLTTYKNGLGGFWNRATWPDYTEFVSADNESRFFAGAGADGVISRSLVVAESLNSATPRPHPGEVPTAFASYHSAFDMHHNVVVGFDVQPGARSGAFATDDYYIRPVDKGHARNPGNLFINSHGGYRSPRPSPSYALAGALWDPYGIWGPPGNYSVYDDPFLTAGAPCVPVPPAGSNALSCAGPYYGILNFVLDQANERWDARMPVHVTRFDDDGAVLGTWSVADGNLISAFANMRHAAVRGDGWYLLDFPSSSLPGDVGLSIENALTLGDSFVLGVRFSGDDPAQVYATTYGDYDNPGFEAHPATSWKRDYAAVGSFEAVLASAGDTFWQDTDGDVVWMKVAGGLEPFWTPPMLAPNSDELLYERFSLRVL